MGRYGGKPATNRLCYDTVVYVFYRHETKLYSFHNTYVHIRNTAFHGNSICSFRDKTNGQDKISYQAFVFLFYVKREYKGETGTSKDPFPEGNG
jgi:hypothetical protein